MRRKRYAVVATASLVILVLSEIMAKIGWLGNWSAAAYVIVSVVLVATFITALVLGALHDKQVDRSEPDNDY